MKPFFAEFPTFPHQYSGSANTRTTPADSRMGQGAGWSRESNRESGSKRNLFSPGASCPASAVIKLEDQEAGMRPLS